MSITVGAYQGSIESALLRLLADDIRRAKRYRNHLHRIRHSTRVIDAEINRLREVVFQIHILKRERRELKDNSS